MALHGDGQAGVSREEAARCWEGNADTWTRLSRAGYDVYRDAFNTPAFFEFLPDVQGKHGLDIGCGEGHNTRRLARRGARVTAIDVAPTFVRHARAAEDAHPLGIDYRVADAAALPFPGEMFEFATAFMSLMDVADVEDALAEAFRVLRPGGFLQFSITHPCFDTPHRRNLRDDEGLTLAIEVGDYFAASNGTIVEWLFGEAPPEVVAGLPPFRVPRFHRTLAEWLNLVIDAGFVVERLAEPRPTDATVNEYPAVQDAQVVAYFLHVRVRKPGVFR